MHRFKLFTAMSPDDLEHSLNDWSEMDGPHVIRVDLVATPPPTDEGTDILYALVTYLPCARPSSDT